MRECRECGQTKRLEEFPRNPRDVEGRNIRCKPCHAARVRASKQNQPQTAAAYNKRRFQSRQRFMQAIKTTAGCVDCGYVGDPGRLHFDHRPDTHKEFSPSHGWSRTWERLVAELEKCEVRCASCHAKRHLEAGDLVLVGAA